MAKKLPKVPKAFMQAVETHRNRLGKVLQGHAAASMKKVYEAASEQLVAKLAKTLASGGGKSFGAYQQRIAIIQLREGQAMIAQKLAGSMKPLTKNAQEKALNGLIGDVKKLHKVFTGGEITLPVEEASVFAGVIHNREPSLLRAVKTSFAKHGVQVVDKVEKQLAVSALTGDTSQETIDQIANLIGGEWWQGERIVRTEMAYAYNSTHRDGILETQEEVPELWMRWEENCDERGQPLDDRVAVDSIAMHGQVVKGPGAMFIMPDSAPFPDKKGHTEVPEQLVGKGWYFPPNRPNDRAALMPWMADWGIPGWLYVGGNRQWL